MMPTVARVLGIGNDARRDDGAGLEVARRLARRSGVTVPVRAGVRDLAELLDLLGDGSRVLVADAVRSGRVPGTVTRWDSRDGGALPIVPVVSTHGLSLAEGIALAGALGRPPDVVIYGIEAEDVSVGHGLGAAASAGVAVAVDRILAELGVPEPAASQEIRPDA